MDKDFETGLLITNLRVMLILMLDDPEPRKTPEEDRLRLDLRSIGERLFELGGTRLMRRAAETVAAARGCVGAQKCLATCAYAWDGIGSDMDRWHA
jgi:hypothetical protein